MSIVSRPLYRTRQFFGALRPRLRREEIEEASAVLGPHLTQLFLTMSPRDQRHCVDVYRKLVAAGYDGHDLLTAALIHDAGKGFLAGPPVRLWHRVAYVLLSTAAPRLLRRLAGRVGGLAVLHHHEQTGAGLAAEYGASHTVVSLLRGGGPEHLAAALRRADEAA
jgi:hypothetical protein